MGLFSRLRAGARKKPTEAPEAVSATVGEGQLASPVSGMVVALKDVPDPVFSTGSLGQGCGVSPSEGVVYAPCTGRVAALTPTLHGIGISADDGTELIVHIGVDTVEMQGDGFTAHVSQGDRVVAGQPLVSFSSEKIKAAGHDDTVIVIVSNSDDFSAVNTVAGGEVRGGDALLEVVR